MVVTDTNNFNKNILHHNDLMNSAKSFCDNFESMADTNKITLVLYGDSRFEEKIILQLSETCLNKTEKYPRFFFD